MDNVISTYYKKYSRTFIHNLNLLISAMLRTGDSNTSKLATAMHKDTKESFKANDMRIYRFLKEEFQVDDRVMALSCKYGFWRAWGEEPCDFGWSASNKSWLTTNTDNFLILTASVDFHGRSIPLFFYNAQLSQKELHDGSKKMEMAFIKGLRHVFSKKYRYIIVADRGFGNKRFSELCQQNGFDYVLRINDNLRLCV